MKTSSIIAGTLKWGVWGANLNTYEIAKNIEEAVSAGIYTFDHADIYGGYTTEEAFGKGFEASGIDRSDVMFISKCGIRYPDAKSEHGVKHYDCTSEHIEASLHASLKKLRTDHLDVFLIHRPSPLLQAEEVVKTLERMREKGKIIEWGVSNFTPSQMQLLGQPKLPTWNQIECSLTQTTPLFDGTLDFHQTAGIGTMAWSPLGSFFKTDGTQPSQISVVMERLTMKYACSSAQILLAWLHKHPARVVPVVGTTKPDRFKDLAKAAELPLELEDWFALMEASCGHKVP